MTTENNIKCPDPASTETRKPRRKILRLLLLYVAIPYVAVTAIFVTVQRRLIYQPVSSLNLSVAKFGLPSNKFSDTQIILDDGLRLNGWLLQGSLNQMGSRADYLVIYFPGNSGNRAERTADLQEIADAGFDVLIFDYRGFGDSMGKPTEASLTQDAQRVWNYARSELKYDESRIVLFGESLGGAVCLSLYSHNSQVTPNPAAVILNSTFTSLPDVVGWHYPYFPFRYLLLDRWNSVERIFRVTSEVIVFHGSADEIIPMSQGQRLADASSNATFIEVPGGSHNMIPTARLAKELIRIRNHQAAAPDENVKR